MNAPDIHVMQVITKGEIGGAQTHLLELCRALQGRVHFSAVIGGDAVSTPLGQALQAQGIAVSQLPGLRNSLNPLRIVQSVRALLQLIHRHRPHVIHAHSAVAGVIARLAGKISQTPVVYTVHGFGFKPQAPTRVRVSAWLAEAVLAAWTTRMVCVSEHERSLASRLPIDPERVSVIHNTLADVPQRARPAQQPSSIVMVARMASPKRPDVLLQALALMARQGLQPSVHLLGDGPLLAAQRALAERLGLSQVQFEGDVDAVAERLSQHQIFVLLSDHEGLPISVLEAMRAGLAIVASRLPGVQELVSDGDSALLVDNNPDQVAQALSRLLADAPLRQRLGEQARARFERAFAPQQMAAQIWRIYQEAPLLTTATWPMTLPRQHTAQLASQRALRQQSHLGWGLLGVGMLVLAYLISLWLEQMGLATHHFGQTVLACAIPYAIAAHLLYGTAHLPAAERKPLLLVTTGLPFLLTPLAFALAQQPYSRGALLLTFVLTTFWFWLADRWFRRHRPFKLVYIDDELPARLHETLAALGAVQAENHLQLIRWPQHWREDPSLCPAALAVQGAVIGVQSGDAADPRTLTTLKLHHIRLYSQEAIAESLSGRVPASKLDSQMWQPDGHPAYDLIKRLLDLALVLGLSPLWLPLGVLAGIAVRLDSPGPALFSQIRTGLHGRPFRIWKLRSMRNEPLAPAQFAQKNDPRITRLGHFIRKTRLDEIPQLWNVLRGDMSLIGPRPEQEKFVQQFAQQIPSYPYRHLVRPGLTGWAQVQQGYAASTDETAVKLSFDLYYVSHYNLGMDLLIALKTVRIVLTGHGAR